MSRGGKVSGQPEANPSKLFQREEEGTADSNRSEVGGGAISFRMPVNGFGFGN